MKTVKEEVAGNLVFYRKKNNMTQKELSDKLKVKNNTVSQWENGVNAIDMDTLHEVCEIFNISVNEMFGIYANRQNEQYTSVEKKIIDDFRSFSREGQEYLINHIKMMSASGLHDGRSPDTV